MLYCRDLSLRDFDVGGFHIEIGEHRVNNLILYYDVARGAEVNPQTKFHILRGLLIK
jgi:hypothetical protein